MITSEMISSESFFQWLAQTSLQASVLIVLIILLQKLLGNQLGARGRYSLWLLFLVRMSMPWAPQSHMSLYNLLPDSLINHTKSHSSHSVAKRCSQKIDAHNPEAKEIGSSPDSDINPQKNDRPVGRTVRGLSLLWLLGICVLAAYTLAASISSRRIMRNGQHVLNRGTLDVLNACKHLIGTHRNVDLIVTDSLGSPALFGLLRPRLLLPRQTLTEATPTELRHIFLHELAHLKRHDILINHIASFLHALHWFNPLVALGFRRMRVDRELACDAMVLSLLAPEETLAYGHTIVGQIQRLSESSFGLNTIGLCSVQVRVKQRLAMIKQFQKNTYNRSFLSISLIGILSCLGLTNALAQHEIISNWDLYARGYFPTTHQDRHANIQRICIRHQQTGQYLVVEDRNAIGIASDPGQTGLWELRFDEASNEARSDVYLYSVAARRYLASDEKGNLTVTTTAPNASASWGTWPRPEGVWLISHYYKNGYLRLSEDSQVRAEPGGRDLKSYWDVHAVWRIKTSDDPASNPQWQREHIPGPD